MRHGERADLAPYNKKSYDKSFDPPLSEEGEQ